MNIKIQEAESEEVKIKREEANREYALKMMVEHIREINKAPKANFDAEAKYYLSENEFDYRKAASAYDEDFKYTSKMYKK